MTDTEKTASWSMSADGVCDNSPGNQAKVKEIFGRLVVEMRNLDGGTVFVPAGTCEVEASIHFEGSGWTDSTLDLSDIDVPVERHEATDVPVDTDL